MTLRLCRALFDATRTIQETCGGDSRSSSGSDALALTEVQDTLHHYWQSKRMLLSARPQVSASSELGLLQRVGSSVPPLINVVASFRIKNGVEMPATLSATPRANELIARLQAQYGRVSFHLSGRFGQTLSCLPEGELRIGGRDVLMGRFRDAPLYMMTGEADAWKDRAMVISLVRGPTRGFSLEGGSGYHFVLLPISIDEGG